MFQLKIFMEKYAIIVAGGLGSRMQSDIPKQFIAVNGLPVLMHTLKAFRQYSEKLTMLLVLPKEQFGVWEQLCEQYSFSVSHQLIAGGSTRFESVKNGLAHITEENCLVAVHDGVRPIISKKIISDSFFHAAEFGSAVASVALKDSIRRVNAEGKNISENRSSFRLIQTPQTFRVDWMREAFAAPYQTHFTDCASVLEAMGHAIQLIEGAYENIKITTPEDLKWAEMYL